eukprot:TRINITY_DN17404_c0_g1::TRINITY_DN17404_c0_g1_i1::g.17938::m.17938 TRINITY_DN17404_c0_g1::TRINITY_DN17404_c0_g1_i1::g.17938  ORF type:complete len:107 (-),score=-18.71,Tegument_dsDNA/PF12818.2/0.038 TRINITY_DN17404_c0_g1_i1:171-491(-)
MRRSVHNINRPHPLFHSSHLSLKTMEAINHLRQTTNIPFTSQSMRQAESNSKIKRKVLHRFVKRKSLYIGQSMIPSIFCAEHLLNNHHNQQPYSSRNLAKRSQPIK